MPPLAVSEPIVLSTHLPLGSLFSRTFCFCQVQVRSFIVSSSAPPCRLPRHLLRRDALTGAGPEVRNRGHMNNDSTEEGN